MGTGAGCGSPGRKNGAQHGVYQQHQPDQAEEYPEFTVQTLLIYLIKNI
jgi:hypothetical protein